jgi:hypothetical protein
MKNFKFLSFLLIAASSLIFMQCSSDYTAIPGQDGINGIDGIDGVDGVDGIDGVGVQECIDCHSSEHREPIHDEYAISGHGSGTSWARGSNTDCAQCHSNEGYIDYLTDLYVDDEGVQSVNQDFAYQGNSITCTGCHAQDQGHRSFDFATDGNDYALRNIDAVHLVIDPTVSVDLANTNEPLGLSNTCVTCHQPRDVEFPEGTDDIIITSYRYGPHHGPQSTMFEGIMGANIPGSVAYPGIGANGDSGHRKGTSCVGCHMDGDSGHSWEPKVGNCVECHSSMTSIPTQITAWTDFQVLHDLLESRGWIDASGYVLNANGDRASSGDPAVYAVKDAQAIWNYKTLEEDKSNGMHNPKYATALLKNTIEYLQGN